MATSPNDRQAKIAAAGGGQRRNVLPMIGAIVAILVVAGVIFAMTRPASQGPEQLGQPTGTTSATTGPSPSATSSSAASDVKLPKGVTAVGAPLAPTPGGEKQGVPTLTIVEDFQCPICKTTEDAFGARTAALAESGKLNVRYYVRTFLDQNLKNDSSQRTAEAAVCAADQGKFLQFKSGLFAKQPANEGAGYSDDTIRAVAKAAGLDAAAFESCYTAKTYAPFVKANNEWANQAGLNSTPMFFVNNKKFEVNRTWTADQYEQAVLAAAQQ